MNKYKSSLLVFIFVINMTYAERWPTDLVPTTMSCSWDDDWANDWHWSFGSSINDPFLSGIHSEHSKSYEDRCYYFKRCKPTSFSFRIGTEIALEVTDYDEFWDRNCRSLGENKAITGIASWYSNQHSDRQFTIFCGSVSSTDYDYTLTNCESTSSYTSYHEDIDYVCPDDKVLRGLSSIPSNSDKANEREDRKFQFECCQIMESDNSDLPAPETYSFEDIIGEWEEQFHDFNREYTLTIGTKSGSTSITDEYLKMLSVIIGSGFMYTYADVSEPFVVTREISQAISSAMENSFTQYGEKSMTVQCDKTFYYQWVLSGIERRPDGTFDIFDVYSDITLCTDAPDPQCPPFMAIDCAYQHCSDKLTHCDDNN